jgi:membrane protease YdiL (CAAX protease family)
LSSRVQPFFQRHKWATFLLQQLCLFATGVAVIQTVRAVTGKSIHGGKDPFGLIDGAAVLAVFALLVLITSRLYRWAEGPAAPPLGLGLTRRAPLDFLLGAAFAFAVMAWPELLGVLLGTAPVTDRIDAHHQGPALLQTLGVGALFLIANSVMEEATSRAFPMQLLRARSILFRIVVPSVVFAAIHLADESFDLGAFYSRALAGVVFSTAYALSGNIWLAVGLHTGWNLAATFSGGTWHAGAVVLIEGTPFGPEWLVDAEWTAIAALGLFWLSRPRPAPVVAA